MGINEEVNELRLDEDTLNDEQLEFLCLMEQGEYSKCFESILARYPELSGSNHLDKLEAKLAGICALQIFVRYNWITAAVVSNEDVFTKTSPEPLFTDVEEVESCVKLLPALAVASKYLVLPSKPKVTDLVWRLRCLIVSQMVLKEASQRLYEEAQRLTEVLHEQLSQPEVTTAYYGCRLVYMKFALEACQLFLWYRDYQNSVRFLEKATQLSSITAELGGSLGKRTLYQQKVTPLLTVHVTRSSDDCETPSCDPICTNGFPKNVSLNSDVLLSEPEFVKGSENQVKLFPEEEALILVVVNTAVRTGSSADDLLTEQALTYLHYLMGNTHDWCVRHKSLYLRSLLERDTKRMERSMMQLNELCDTYEKPDGMPVLRMELFYAALPPPHWSLKRDFANSLLRLGCVKSALDVYLGLNMWEDIVRCYQLLEKPEKAEVLVREQLEKGKTPYLLCLLGDVTRDVSLYEEAWELSNGRYARAQASLGNHYFYTKNYAQCIECYQKTLDINSLQISIWQRLGYAALDTADYELSAKAYRRFLQFEPDVFEAWNNLAKAYINLGDKARAWRAFQEALKCNYEEWRVWENYLVISTAIGAFDDVIMSWHRLLDLKNKHQDDAIIDILVETACDDSETEQKAKFAAKLQQLLGRISSTGLCSKAFWKSYAKLLTHKKENLDKVLNCFKKSHQAAVNQSSNWEKQLSTTKEMLEHCVDLTEYYKISHSSYEEKQDIESAFNLFKLNLRSVLSTVNQSKAFVCSDDGQRDELDGLIGKLTNCLNYSLSQN